MSMSFGHYQIQKCGICQEPIDEHVDDCPVGRIERARLQQKHIPCPECDERAVDVNQSDFYECRKCHEQFCAGDYGEKADRKIVFLDDPAKEDLVLCFVLKKKGDGNFPLDKLIERLENQIKELEG